jgi:hypothetical protein
LLLQGGICATEGAAAGLGSTEMKSRTLSVKFRFRAAAALLAWSCLLAGAPAVPARAQSPLRSVNEYGRLSLKSSRGATIFEQGSGWGSFGCAVSITLTVDGTLVRASYLAHPHGGSIRGSARAYIRSANKAGAYYSGTIWLHGGTGAYAGASGSASFSGTINRKTYAMSLRIAGRVRL